MRMESPEQQTPDMQPEQPEAADASEETVPEKEPSVEDQIESEEARLKLLESLKAEIIQAETEDLNRQAA